MAKERSRIRALKDREASRSSANLGSVKHAPPGRSKSQRMAGGEACSRTLVGLKTQRASVHQHPIRIDSRELRSADANTGARRALTGLGRGGSVALIAFACAISAELKRGMRSLSRIFKGGA